MAKTRFWKWYRTIPIMSMLLIAGLSLGFVRLPGALARQYLYPVSYEQAILESSERHGVDPLLVCAVIKCESN